MDVTPSQALERIAAFYGFPVSVLRRDVRYPELVRARDAFVWWCRTHRFISYKGIGRLVGKHHTTIMAAWRRAERRVAEDALFASETKFIAAMLGGNTHAGNASSGMTRTLH